MQFPPLGLAGQADLSSVRIFPRPPRGPMTDYSGLQVLLPSWWHSSPTSSRLPSRSRFPPESRQKLANCIHSWWSWSSQYPLERGRIVGIIDWDFAGGSQLGSQSTGSKRDHIPGAVFTCQLGGRCFKSSPIGTWRTILSTYNHICEGVNLCIAKEVFFFNPVVLINNNKNKILTLSENYCLVVYGQEFAKKF